MDAAKQPSQVEETYLDFIAEVFSAKEYKALRNACLQQDLMLLEELLKYGLATMICQMEWPHVYTIPMLEKTIELHHSTTAKLSFACTDISIARIYPEKIFGSFISFCHSYDIRQVRQLTKHHFQQLRISLKRVELEAVIAVYLVVAHSMSHKLAMSLLTSTQMKRYLQTLPEVLVQWQRLNTSDSDSLIATNKNPKRYELDDPFYHSVALDALLPTDLCLVLRDMNLTTLSDLMQYNGMFSFLRKKQKRDVIYLLALCEEPLATLAIMIQKEMLAHENFEVLYLRVVEHRTLEEVGLLYQVTRERIRQKELTLKTLWLQRMRFFLARLDYEVKIQQYAFDIQVILAYFSDYKYKQGLEEILKDLDGTKVSYCHALRGFFWDFDSSALVAQLSKLLVEDYFLIEDTYQQLKEREEFACLPYEYFLNGLSYFGYQEKQRFAINCTCTARKIVEILTLRHFPQGIQLIPTQYEAINQLAIQELGTSFLKGTNCYRNAKVYFEPSSTNQLILWGKSTVIHIQNVVIEEALRDFLLREFDDLMVKYEAISARFLYDQLKQYLTNTNLTDRVKLYGYIKHFYQDRFWFRKMFIRNVSKRGVRILEFIESYVEQHKVVSMLQLQEATKCNEITLSAALVNSEKLVLKHHGRSMTTISEYQLPKEFKEKLLLKIQHGLYKGYMTCHRLYQENRSFFVGYGILDEVEAFTISKLVLNEKYNFYRPFIQAKQIERVVTYRGIFLGIFAKELEVDIHEMESRYNQRLASKGITNVITKLFQDDMLFQLTKHTFCLIDDVSMTPSMITQLRTFVVSLFYEKEYVLKQVVLASSNKFPSIEFAVKNKPYLMDVLSFRLLVKKFLDEDYIVFDNSNISSYIDRDYCIVSIHFPIKTYAGFLHYLLKQGTKGKALRQREMLLILRGYGIDHKKLPVELEREGYISFDTQGNVHVNQSMAVEM